MATDEMNFVFGNAPEHVEGVTLDEHGDCFLDLNRAIEVENEGRTLDRLHIREPRAAQLKTLSRAMKQNPDDEYGAMMEMLPQLVDVPPDTLDDLTAFDLKRATLVLGNYMEFGKPTSDG